MDIRDATVNLLASSSAGLIGRIFCHPIDTIKARLQSSSYLSYSNSFSLLRSTWKQEGFQGLYRGFGIVAVGGIPATCAYLTSYDMSKEFILEKHPTISPFSAYLACGVIAEAVSCVLFVPVDVIKERLQIQNSFDNTKISYKGSWNALSVIMRQEGLIGLYKGYGATLASFGPFSALYFLFYENIKTSLATLLGDSNQLSFEKLMLCSAAAGAAASIITAPLDLAKLRLQIQRSDVLSSVGNSSVRYRGVADVLSSVCAQQGMRGLFRGAGARVLFHCPSTAITMASFEEAKKYWSRAIL